MVNGLVLSVGLLLAGVTVDAGVQATPAAQPVPQKIGIVSVTGCLKENGANSWMIVNATDPAASTANAPAAAESSSALKVGKNQFTLIGVSEFNLPQHKDHTVLVKGLLIKATPVSRINITSVTMLAPSCAAQPAK